ncbi:hypothetical protein ACQEVC_30970 [Plantactinospora sp. CA-294935]|uniref:hypothetical protein n=1 Tax=Plantactinospora sp. CA-294935 TaxID=3240012 RepID=UPI003D8E2483
MRMDGPSSGGGKHRGVRCKAAALIGAMLRADATPFVVTTALRSSAELVAWIRAEGLELCGFDFGGTLLDFEPIHVRSFLLTLDIVDRVAERRVRHIVRASLHEGKDSVEMAWRIIRALSLDADPVQVAVEKRAFVEVLTARLILDADIVRAIVAVSEIAEIAVITRGTVQSTSGILRRSLPAHIFNEMQVVGREFLSGRLDKCRLLADAITSRPVCRAGYVGDSDEDKRIAEDAGIPFFMFRPFC